MSEAVELEDIKLDSETDLEPESDSEKPHEESGSRDDQESHSQGEAEGADAPEPDKKKDPSTFNIIQAAQYGELERCRELVERHGVDVTEGDEEGISVLHWAAINNRLSVASYFIQKGANVNAIGGELMSSPIHWATRQGHLTMVVHLMRYGARPESVDCEGLNCLHIAAQFGFTNIAAYFISCRTPIHIDTADSRGCTALMHGAFGASKTFDPVRILVSLGASLSAMDSDNNTALHHAARTYNHPAVTVLVEAGAPIECKNKEGKTPYDLAQECNYSYGMDVIHMWRQKRFPRGIIENVTRNPRVAWWVMLLFPLVLLTVLGLVGELCSRWWIYLIATTVVGWVSNRIIVTYMNVLSVSNPGAFGIIIGTKALIYVTVMAVYVPAGTHVHYYWMHLALFVTMYVFYRVSKSDPGFIRQSSGLQEAHRVIAELCETARFQPRNFCSTCLVRRPLRSKHCSACNRCVARLDHHCPWINNCVGLRNHKLFLAYIVCLLFMLTWSAKAALGYLYIYFPATHGNKFSRMYHYVTAEPWVGFIMVMSFVHMIWVYFLLLAQIFQMICQGMTTNEKANAFRYGHFLEGHNPFNKGIFANAAEFLGFTCCTNRRDRIDWMTAYTIPPPRPHRKHPLTTESTHPAPSSSSSSHVKIPMPYSSSWDPDRDQLTRSGNTVEEEEGEGGGLGVTSSSEDESTCREQFPANAEYKI